jgi:hypothetical protein
MQCLCDMFVLCTLAYSHMRTLRRPPSRTAKKQLLMSRLLPDEKDAYTGTSEIILEYKC